MALPDNGGFLPEGVVFRCELLDKPKHNSLKYDRTPVNNIMLFDVELGESEYAYDRETLCYWTHVLNVEPVPELFRGVINSMDEVTAREYALVAVGAGAAILALLPLALSAFGSAWRPGVKQTGGGRQRQQKQALPARARPPRDEGAGRTGKDHSFQGKSPT